MINHLLNFNLQKTELERELQSLNDEKGEITIEVREQNLLWIREGGTMRQVHIHVERVQLYMAFVS